MPFDSISPAIEEIEVPKTKDRAWKLFTGPDTFLQNRFHNIDHTAFCVVGAIEHVYRGSDVNGALTKLGSDVNVALTKLGNPGIVLWNDAPGRQWFEVRDLLKELDL